MSPCWAPGTPLEVDLGSGGRLGGGRGGLLGLLLAPGPGRRPGRRRWRRRCGLRAIPLAARGPLAGAPRPRLHPEQRAARVGFSCPPPQARRRLPSPVAALGVVGFAASRREARPAARADVAARRPVTRLSSGQICALASRMRRPPVPHLRRLPRRRPGGAEGVERSRCAPLDVYSRHRRRGHGATGDRPHFWAPELDLARAFGEAHRSRRRTGMPTSSTIARPDGARSAFHRPLSSTSCTGSPTRGASTGTRSRLRELLAQSGT